MKMKVFILTGGLTFLTSMFAGEKRALIVAISNYPVHSGWHEIHADKDADLLDSTLTRLGFPKKNIVILKDSIATKKRIVNEMKTMRLKARKGDTVVIHFSCHGQLMEDFNGDEPDGLDEALIPYDAQLWYSAGKYEGENHLCDDEIDSLLLPLRERLGEKGSLLLSLDACHSQSGNRGYDDDEAVVRGTAAVFARTSGYRGKLESEAPNPPLVQKHGLAPITVLSACKSNENNYEYENTYGLLTYSLCRVWNQYPSLPAYAVWSEEVKKKMKEIGRRPQTPVFETTVKQ
jgi:hypothetical protein